MATLHCDEERLPDRDEVFYPNADMIDGEPLYNNFTSIQNYDCEEKMNTYRNHNRTSSDNTFRAIRLPIDPVSNTVVDGSIFNLIQIFTDIGCDASSPFLRDDASDTDTQCVNALAQIVSDVGGAFGPLVNIWRRRVDNEYFQRCYLESRRRSASMITNNSTDRMNQMTTQKTNHHRVKRVSHHLVSRPPMSEQDDDKQFQREIQRIYGFDDIETNSTVSSRRSSVDENPLVLSPNQRPLSPIILNPVSNARGNQTITIREYYPSSDKAALLVDRSLSSVSSEQTNHDHEQNSTRYNQSNRVYLDHNRDSAPELIHRPNPEQVTYKQNVSIRYLVPPTPPPPGPLIIRERIAPRAATPSPLIIQDTQSEPRTPSPLILREAPPTPPLQQEPTIITKVVPPSADSFSQLESAAVDDTSLPPKPQSIIIEKWLPYKPAPSRQVIYEYVTEVPVISEFQPNTQFIHRQRAHSADIETRPSDRIPIPVTIERHNSSHLLHNSEHHRQAPSLFEQFAASTQREIEAMQRQTLEQIQANQQWMADQWHQQTQLLMPMLPPLTTPTLVVNHPPVTRMTFSYPLLDFPQENLYESPYVYPYYA